MLMVKPVFWSAVKLFETVKGAIIAQKVLQKNFSVKKRDKRMFQRYAI